MTATGEQRPVQSTRPGVRLTRRGRVSVALVLLGALLAAFWLGTWRASAAATEGASPGAAYETIVLHEGQTLWDIATRRVPGTDPRITVRGIMELNRLSGAAVWTGQRIRVPTAG